MTFSTVYNRALGLLSRRNHSRYELRRKLLRKGTSDVLDQVLDHLESQGYLDDQGFAYERALRQRQSKYWGSRKISNDLRSLGISERIILEVLEQVENECAEARSLKEAVQFWVERFGPLQTVSQLKRLYDHCARLGHGPQIVREELRPFFKVTEENSRDRL